MKFFDSIRSIGTPLLRAVHSELNDTQELSYGMRAEIFRACEFMRNVERYYFWRHKRRGCNGGFINGPARWWANGWRWYGFVRCPPRALLANIVGGGMVGGALSWRPFGFGGGALARIC